MNTGWNLSDNWQRADAWQKQMRDTFLSIFYGKYALNGRYVFIEKSACSTLLQKRLAIDTILASPKSGSVCIEEKIVQWKGFPYRRFFLETKSCTNKGHESLGWMHYAQADYLLYAFEQSDHSGLIVYLLNFSELRDWFWKHFEAYEVSILGSTFNHTEGRLVDIEDVVASVSSAKYIVTHEKCEYIPYRKMRGKS